MNTLDQNKTPNGYIIGSIKKHNCPSCHGILSLKVSYDEQGLARWGYCNYCKGEGPFTPCQECKKVIQSCSSCFNKEITIEDQINKLDKKLPNGIKHCCGLYTKEHSDLFIEHISPSDLRTIADHMEKVMEIQSKTEISSNADKQEVIPDYRLSFGGRLSLKLEKQGYKHCGTCQMDNGVTGNIYIRHQNSNSN